MTQDETCCLIMVTAPKREVATDIAEKALSGKLAACVQLVPGLESHYWWEGKVQCDEEILLLFKTRKELTTDLHKLVVQLHPYDTPEFVELPITGGSQPYLDWIKSSTTKNQQDES